MKHRINTNIIILIIILVLSVSCQLLYGPDLAVSIKITHIESKLIENNGVGEQWQNIYWEVDGNKMGIGTELGSVHYLSHI